MTLTVLHDNLDSSADASVKMKGPLAIMPRTKKQQDMDRKESLQGIVR
jgi:hypothetical protein